MAYSKHGAVRDGILAFLEANPAGGFASNWAEQYGLRSTDIGKLLHYIGKRGNIKSIAEGQQCATNRRRYYLAKYEAEAMAAHEATRGVEWGVMQHPDYVRGANALKWQKRKEKYGIPDRKPRAKPEPKSVSKPSKVWNSSGLAEPKPKAPQIVAQPEVDYSRAKITKCPSCHDMRHTVHKPEPFFSAMRPGSYLPADTWTARVYGGGR